MSSSSKTSISSALIVLLVCAGVAHAGGRKRIVVLEFSGPKAEKFHDDVVKLIKKQHTVVPSEKWNSTADELDAGNVTEKNIKKVAKKLKVDGVVTGKIEKRRDEYIVHLKLRSGTSGEMAGQGVDTKSDSGRLDGKAQRDVKDELMTSIDDLEANHGGGGGGDDDEADKPAKKDKKVAKSDDDDDAKPAKKTKKAAADDDDDSADSKPVKKGFSKKTFDKGGDSEDDAKPAKKSKKAAGGDDDDTAAAKPAKKDKKAAKSDDDTSAALSTKHDDDESPLPKSKKAAKSDDDSGDDDSSSKKKKRVAKKDDDDSGGGGGDGDTSAEAEAGDSGDLATQLSPSERAIDFGAGMSFTARRMTWDAKPYLTGTQIPPAYTQSVPVAGAVFDATVYPLAFGHKRHDALAGVGVELLYDKVVFINSKKLYTDNTTMKQVVATLDTSESHFGLAGVFRYPLGKGEKAPVVGGKLAYETQSFNVAQTTNPNATPTTIKTDIPNVEYSIIEPSAFIRYPAIPKLTLQADIGFLVVTGAGTAAGPMAGTGDIGNSTVYGQATASGYDLQVGAEYSLTTRIFARGVFRLEHIGFTFKSDPNTLANTRDSDNTTQDVTGASDMYFGGYAMVGFLY